jgi:hypothetical protein
LSQTLGASLALPAFHFGAMKKHGRENVSAAGSLDASDEGE